MSAGLPGGPEHDDLPLGLTVALAAGVRRVDGGRTLVGGSPPRVLHLRPAAQGRLGDDGRLVVADRTTARLARLLLDAGLVDPCVDVPPPGTPDADDVTVVVPVRDRPEQLDRLLDALPDEVRVVVVDDGSVDDRTGAVARGHGAHVVRRAMPAGPAAARNAGLREVTTPLVAFLDSDVVPRPGWLTALLAHLADPAVGVVAPRVESLEPGRGWVGRYEAARSSLDLGADAALVVPRSRVSYVPSAALLARTAALGAGFDESMHVAEDVDLVWRVQEAGWRVRYEPAARVGHDHRVEVREWLSRKAFYGTGAAPLARRHPGAVAPVVLAPWTAGVAVALLAQRRWSLPVAAGLTAAATWRLSTRLPGSDHPLRTAAELTPQGVVAAVAQTSSGITRHWWPVAALACARSRRARRAVAVAMLVDGLLDLARVRPGLDPVRYLAARRLDDLAYGAGLWWGAARDRSAAALLPDLGVGAALPGLLRRGTSPTGQGSAGSRAGGPPSDRGTLRSAVAKPLRRRPPGRWIGTTVSMPRR